MENVINHVLRQNTEDAYYFNHDDDDNTIDHEEMKLLDQERQRYLEKDAKGAGINMWNGVYHEETALQGVYDDDENDNTVIDMEEMRRLNRERLAYIEADELRKRGRSTRGRDRGRGKLKTTQRARRNGQNQDTDNKDAMLNVINLEEVKPKPQDQDIIPLELLQKQVRQDSEPESEAEEEEEVPKYGIVPIPEIPGTIKRRIRNSKNTKPTKSKANPQKKRKIITAKDIQTNVIDLNDQDVKLSIKLQQEQEEGDQELIELNEIETDDEQEEGTVRLDAVDVEEQAMLMEMFGVAQGHIQGPKDQNNKQETALFVSLSSDEETEGEESGPSAVRNDVIVLDGEDDDDDDVIQEIVFIDD
ncbi:hypothetical protein WICPIJ_001570 [Wickerhamomyces pijperi]|uniref:Uncharacterized protein n=1 Tax=Wickerhamomyces pijperi TaxID=599730 RepID=A0A9P8QDC2_WICPI|nr:hypothetical protein WICPIJ_001570 [Wickerhamomyces pijperi]